MNSNFCVIDTEGYPLLHEISLVNIAGEVFYDAFTPETERTINPDLIKPLVEILEDIRDATRSVTLVAHNASYDERVLRKSYESVGLSYPNFDFVCTYQLTQVLFPDLEAYGLEFLCQHFDLGPNRFMADRAHIAAYDATYTYHLYRHLQLEGHRKRLISQPNPYSSTRVDTPFQSFVDAVDIYAFQSQKLKSVLGEISQDINQQSRGVALIGEPGSGKTHLMMRLANEVIQSNRVLFIRQPTNVNAVFYHIYARILESLVETADDSNNTQLDLLLIRSIRTIMTAIPEGDRTQRDRDILAALADESLNALGKDTSNLKRDRWLRIEKHVLEWWTQHFSLSGYREQILKGLLRYCRYTEPHRREVLRKWLSVGEISEKDSERFELSAWCDRANREEFSLQAMQILGDFSTLDKPLIIVFDQLEGLWQAVNEPILVKFGEVLKELFTHVSNSLIITTLFPDRWQQFQSQFDGSITERVSQYVLTLDCPTPEQFQSIVQSRLAPLEVQSVEIFPPEDLDVILKQRSIRHCLNRANDYYAYRIKGDPLSPQVHFSTRPSQTRETQLEQRVNLLERKLDSLYDLVKSFASNPQIPEQENKSSIIEKIEEIESVSVVNSDHLSSEFHRYLSAQIEAITTHYSKPQIITDDDDVGKLRQICHAFSSVKSVKMSELRLGHKKLPEHLLISDKHGQRFVGFLHSESLQSVNSRLINLNQLVLEHPNISFIMIRDRQLREISSPKASLQLTRFKNAKQNAGRRTHFQYLELERRVEFELVFKLVNDIVNRDLDLSMLEGLSSLVESQPRNWIVKLLSRAEVS